MYFVTGATGLVGSYVVRHLVQAGHKVRALYRKRPEAPLLAGGQGGIEWVQGDVLDVGLLADALQGCQYAVHAAAMVSFDPRDKAQMLKTNVEGTANVVNACLQVPDLKLVHISSVAALGLPNEQNTVDERSTWTPEAATSAYAYSKYLAEMEVWRGVAEGLRAVVLNPSVVLGLCPPQQSTGQLFNYVWEENRYYTGGYINLVGANDLARAVLALLHSPIEGQRFVLNAAHWPYQRFFAEVAKALGKPAPDKLLGSHWLRLAAMFSTVWAWLSGGRPRLSTEAARAAHASHRYESRKIEQALGLRFADPAEVIAQLGQAYQAILV